tara:strand:- start:1124 stop:1375 length:252 start_codon:yes stop_codon:yes gene_type:complete
MELTDKRLKESFSNTESNKQMKTKEEVKSLLEKDNLNFKLAFEYAFSVGHISPDEDYMFMGYEENTIFFKDKITRKYKNLQLI